MDILKTFSITSWQETFSTEQSCELTKTLENGNILSFPKLAFSLSPEETNALSFNLINERVKNISYNPLTHEIKGIDPRFARNHSSISDNASTIKQILTQLISRFSGHAHQLVNALFPHYEKSLMVGRTSLRPVEITGRKTSYRKDDTRLHVDSFPASPNHGKRILRVFSNINPEGKPRVWRVGEPFEQVVQQFLPLLRKPFIGSAQLLELLKITKQKRSLYDHYMLQIHNAMKADVDYQRTAEQQEIHFTPGSTWIVQTDHVSHAAMSGQHVLEQTFYLPFEAMQDPTKSPFRVLEKFVKLR